MYDQIDLNTEVIPNNIDSPNMTESTQSNKQYLSKTGSSTDIDGITSLTSNLALDTESSVGNTSLEESDWVVVAKTSLESTGAGSVAAKDVNAPTKASNEINNSKNVEASTENTNATNEQTAGPFGALVNLPVELREACWEELSRSICDPDFIILLRPHIYEPALRPSFLPVLCYT